MKSSNSERILLPVYFIMVAVAVCLNVLSGGKPDMANVVVNISMFIIIGAVILWANTQCFMPVNKMLKSMKYAVETMEIDFNKSGAYLWEQYKDETNLFHNKALNKKFNEYRLERKRMNMLSAYGSKCDVSEYINEDYFDAAIKKGILSIIPGVMTGLGILGTFIGLSIGLQNFNTGSAAEITSSIAPLMGGIKVAFHTSIYGMVFSLIFNFVYKKNLEDAYNSVEYFLNSYHKYVLPDVASDEATMLLNFQERQMEEMEKMLDEFGDKLAVKIAAALRNPYGK